MLKKIAKRINKELEQARDYIHQAYLVKHEASQTAELFITLAEEEIVHAEKLLREGRRLTESKQVYSYEKTEPVNAEAEKWHEKCKIIWEWETRMATDEINECRQLLSKYRGG